MMCMPHDKNIKVRGGKSCREILMTILEMMMIGNDIFMISMMYLLEQLVIF